MKSATTDMKSLRFIYLAVTVILTGCVSEGGKKVSWTDIDNAERETLCVVLSSDLEDIFSFEKYRIKQLDRGRISVIAEIRNRTRSEQKVEISTVFRDQEGLIFDQSVWQKFSFTPNQTLYYRISSLSAANNFTIRIRKITNQQEK